MTYNDVPIMRAVTRMKDGNSACRKSPSKLSKRCFSGTFGTMRFL
jgi:hypothetical protein